MVHVESRSWKTTNGISHKPGYFLFTLRAMTQSFRTKKCRHHKKIQNKISDKILLAMDAMVHCKRRIKFQSQLFKTLKVASSGTEL